MHIYFSGVGGAGIGPLALIAHQAGFSVSGSDLKKNSTTDYLQKQGINNIHIGQDYEQIAAIHKKQPIDWFVHTSALGIDQPDAPELRFCAEHTIRTSLRDEFLIYFLQQKNLQMIAIAGTHGKTTTTAMMIYACKQLGLPISYSVGAKLSFGEMGQYDPKSHYFVYEADEYARNFLAFRPAISLVTGVDWDHPDVYPSRDDYYNAFRQFIHQSGQSVLWQDDYEKLALDQNSLRTLDQNEPQIDSATALPGHVNRLNAWQVAHALPLCFDNLNTQQALQAVGSFPGVSRRFEQLAPNIYTDYAHTPPKIRGALQMAHEVAGPKVVVVYEGLHNTRQHFIKHELKHIFDDVKQLYIVPSYLAREDPNLATLTPADLRSLLSGRAQTHATPIKQNDFLLQAIKTHAQNGDLILALSAGGSGSLDEWLRQNIPKLTS